MAEAPKITQLPDPPNRATDTPEQFTEKYDATLAAQRTFVDETNALGEFIVNTAVDASEAIEASATAVAAKNAAVASANNAAASATAAESASGSIGNLALLHALTIAM